MGVSYKFHALQTAAYPLDRKQKGQSGDKQEISLEVFTASTVNSTSFLEHEAV